jgi:phosphopantothenoylcysteine synthetase/decarboxylase
VSGQPALYVIGASAPPVRQLTEACRLALDAGWQTYVTLTPTAAEWVDLAELQTVTGHPIRVNPRRPGESDLFPPADAVLAAPLTFNTINKWAHGINDTVALGLLNELLSGEPTIVAVPCVKLALQAHPAYAASVGVLEASGVRFLDDSIVTRGEDGLAAFDWQAVVRHLSRITSAAQYAARSHGRST